jgi:GNAT superfamily N-acetyltransferase
VASSKKSLLHAIATPNTIGEFDHANQSYRLRNFASPSDLQQAAGLTQAVFEPDLQPRRSGQAPANTGTTANRATDWFIRKMEREGIVPELSLSIFCTSIPGAVEPIGLALVGMDKQADRQRAFLATFGLRARFRHQGLGSVFFSKVVAFLRDYGCRELEVLAEAHKTGWYIAHGAKLCEGFVTARTHGLANRSRIKIGNELWCHLPCVHHLWPQRSWHRSAARQIWEICTKDGFPFWALVSQQATSWMLHELRSKPTPDGALTLREMLMALRAAAPRGAGLVAPHLPIRSTCQIGTDDFMVKGYDEVQRGERLLLRMSCDEILR